MLDSGVRRASYGHTRRVTRAPKEPRSSLYSPPLRVTVRLLSAERQSMVSATPNHVHAQVSQAGRERSGASFGAAWTPRHFVTYFGSHA